MRPIAGRPGALVPGDSLEEMERALCRSTLEACGGNVAMAARRLGMTRPALDYRLRKWGIVGERAKLH